MGESSSSSSTSTATAQPTAIKANFSFCFWKNLFKENEERSYITIEPIFIKLDSKDRNITEIKISRSVQPSWILTRIYDDKGVDKSKFFMTRGFIQYEHPKTTVKRSKSFRIYICPTTKRVFLVLPLTVALKFVD